MTIILLKTEIVKRKLIFKIKNEIEKNLNWY